MVEKTCAQWQVVCAGLCSVAFSRSEWWSRGMFTAVVFTPWPGNGMLDLATSSAVLDQAPPAFYLPPRPEPSVSMHTQGARQTRSVTPTGLPCEGEMHRQACDARIAHSERVTHLRGACFAVRRHLWQQTPQERRQGGRVRGLGWGGAGADASGGGAGGRRACLIDELWLTCSCPYATLLYRRGEGGA